MGLDILIGANNQGELDAGTYNPHDHCLSRRFGYFMCRRSASPGVPELDQLGQLTSVDISPLYEMEDYPLPEDVNSMLEYAEDEAERQRILEEARAATVALTGNIDRVMATVQGLLAHLATIADLPARLLPDEYDTLQPAAYFANFAAPRMNAYDNTFGQDLRNFERFLDYAKSMGTVTVFFVYG